MTHPNKASAVRLRILGILIAMSFIAYLLRTNLSFAAPEMMADLGLSEIQWGWVMAAFTAGYTIFQFPGGVLGDRLGPRRVLTALVILWVTFTVVTSLVPSGETSSVAVVIGSLMLVRFLVGVTHAPVFPVINTSVVRWFPPGRWALPQGLSSTGLTLGGAAGAIAVPFLVAELGWRQAFLVIAPLGLVIAWLWWWYARDNPRDHAGVNEAEADFIEAGRGPSAISAPAVAPAGALEPGPPMWLQVLRNRDVLLLTLSYASMNYVFYIVFNWFFYYLVEVRGFSATDAGFVTSAQWIAGAVGATFGGWLCDRMCRTVGLRWGCRWPIVLGMGISVLLLLVGAFHPSAWIAVTAMVLLFFFNQINEGPYWAASIAVGGRHAGAAGGVMNTGANAMGVVNSLLVPWLAFGFGWTVAIASAAVFALAGIVLMLLVRADCPVE
ncbi:MAG: MFS transporter [Xanthomonadales bacterium]|jgi:ACS family glucarate transporter-like MFS transporter|nr:MFS transporter [Xanthomonadales bacterium]